MRAHARDGVDTTTTTIIYHVTNSDRKELRTFSMNPELRKLVEVLKEIGMTYSSLVREKTTRIEQLKLCMVMGPVEEAREVEAAL